MMNELAGSLVYFMCMALIAVGLLGIVLKRNLVKIIIALGAIETGINLIIIAVGYKAGGTAPIFTGLSASLAGGEILVDPIPQALTLTSIVIGASVTALALSIAIRLHRVSRSLDADEVGRQAGVKL